MEEETGHAAPPVRVAAARGPPWVRPALAACMLAAVLYLAFTLEPGPARTLSGVASVVQALVLVSLAAGHAGIHDARWRAKRSPPSIRASVNRTSVGVQVAAARFLQWGAAAVLWPAGALAWGQGAGGWALAPAAAATVAAWALDAPLRHMAAALRPDAWKGLEEER